MDRTNYKSSARYSPRKCEASSHDFTPARAKVRGAAEFCDRMGMDYFKEDIFRTLNVTSQQGWESLKDGAFFRRLHNEPDREEPRGRNPLISPGKIREMERILETEGIEARSYTLEQLGFEVGLECSGRTVQRAMGTMDYHKCIACRRGWVNQKTAKDRMNWASVMLERYPEPKSHTDIVVHPPPVGAPPGLVMRCILATAPKISSTYSRAQ